MLRIIILLCLSVISANAATCNLYFEAKKPGVFTRSFGSKRMIVPLEGNKITFEDTTPVTGYCATGFRGYSYSTSTPQNQLLFTCSSNSIYYSIPGTGGTYSLSNSGTLNCPSESMYYEAKLMSCKDYGLEYGFSVDKIPVIFANICFNLNTMRTKFIHYVAATRTSILENQELFNPGNSTAISSDPIEVLFPSSEVERENKSLIAAVQTEIPNYAKFVEYQLDKLIPMNIATGTLQSYGSNFETTNMVAWWKTLKLGNWKEVEAAIAQISIDGVYDVFAGSSGSVIYPYDGKYFVNKPLTYKVDQYTRTVPLYVWNYIKKRNSVGEGVAIIGVNSPFFDVKGQAICEDICDTFPWLSVVNKVRNIVSLGKIFCCRASDVEKLLDGFPIL